MSDDLITTAEAAALLRVSPRTIQTWIARRYIPGIRTPSGQLRIPRAELERKIEAWRVADAAASAYTR